MSSSRTAITLLAGLLPISSRSFSLVNPPSLGMWKQDMIRTWALDVADNASGGIVHELDSDLGNTSTGSYIASVPILQLLLSIR